MSELILWVTRERIDRGNKTVHHATIDGKELNGDVFIYNNAVKKDAFTELPIEIRNLISKKELRIVIRDGIKKISSGAFKGCTNLVSLEFDLQEMQIEIGTSAFEDCTNLISIVIPNTISVKKIGRLAFFNCPNLGNVIWNQTLFHCRITNGCASIPDDVKAIGDWAFEKCVDLIKIERMRGVERIGKGAFLNCTGLREVKIPSSVREIGSSAFSGCTALNKIARNKGGLKAVILGIGSKAFSGCTNLTSVEIPNGVQEVRWETFSDCTGLREVKIPSSVREIGYGAFRGCGSLKQVVTTQPEPPSAKEQNQIREIGWEAFSDCTSLIKTAISDETKIIRGRAFSGCSSLREVRIPDNVITIEQDAFVNCQLNTYVDTRGFSANSSSEDPESPNDIDQQIDLAQVLDPDDTLGVQTKIADLEECFANLMEIHYSWNGITEDNTVYLFNGLTRWLENALNREDESSCKDCIENILEWGGINQHRSLTDDFYKTLIKFRQYYSNNGFPLDRAATAGNKTLHDVTLDDQNLLKIRNDTDMKHQGNYRISSWSKILAANTPGTCFIYDSRVARALSIEFADIDIRLKNYWTIPADRDQGKITVGRIDIPDCYNSYHSLLQWLSTNESIVGKYNDDNLFDANIRKAYRSIGFSDQQAIMAHLEKVLFMRGEQKTSKDEEQE